MSEEVQAVESVEPSVEDSSPSTAQSDNSFDFATDLSMDNDTQVESNGAGTTTNFDAGSVTNWAAEDKSKVPEQYHGVIDQAKKQQADYTRKTQDLADQRRQFEQQMLQQNQMIQTLQQQINQPQNQQNNDPYADLRERLGPDESSAIDVVRQIIKTESQGYEDKLSKIDQLEKGVTALLQQQNVGRLQSAASQLQEARDKHERLLRPRLGSPDAAAELQELDDREHERSAEYTDNIVKFRSQLIQDLVVTCGKFCEDVGVSSKSLIQYIDTSMRLEAIELPPGTAVPKKRMTLKRLRKAKRIQDAIARGEEDRSIERDWPALDLGGIARLVESVEDLVPELTDEASEQKSLLTTEWVEATQSKSIVHGAVSTAHRILINERDTAIQNFCAQLADSFFEIRETYGTLLEHEKSWLERWEMQVKMLRSGDL